MFCPYCANELKDGSKFCGKCGRAIPAPATATPTMSVAVPRATPAAPGAVPAMAPTPTASVAVPTSATTSAVGAVATPAAVGASIDIGAVVRRVLQAIVCLVIAALTLGFLYLGSTFILETSADTARNSTEFSLFQIATILMFGEDPYNATILSIVMGLTIIVLIFTTFFAWLAAALAALINRGKRGFRLMAIILAVPTLAAVCALPHLTNSLVSHTKMLFAKSSNVLLEDVVGLSAPLTYVWAGIIVVLIIGLVILAVMAKKKVN